MTGRRRWQHGDPVAIGEVVTILSCRGTAWVDAVVIQTEPWPEFVHLDSWPRWVQGHGLVPV